MKVRTGVLISGLLLATSAQATVIDFESHPTGPSGTSLTTQGYTLSATGGFGTTLFVQEDSNYGPETKYLNWFILQTTLSIEEENQGLFDLHSFDLSTSEISGSPEVQLTGFLSGGGTVSTTLAITELAFSNYVFGSEWSGLERIEFGSPQAFSGVIDNINLSQVPIPAAFWLLGSGLGLLGWMRKRKGAVRVVA